MTQAQRKYLAPEEIASALPDVEFVSIWRLPLSTAERKRRECWGRAFLLDRLKQDGAWIAPWPLAPARSWICSKTSDGSLIIVDTQGDDATEPGDDHGQL